MPTVHLLIKGEVQGVFYRATAREEAGELNITGWIKNRNNGDVEAMATGDQQSLEKFIEWCRKGPKKAVVEEVLVTQENETTFDDFTVIRGMD